METIDRVRDAAAVRGRLEADVAAAQAALARARRGHREAGVALAGALVDGRAAGATYRELAEAAGIAHQRVHQIVRAAH
jgi:hypothetical protein